MEREEFLDVMYGLKFSMYTCFHLHKTKIYSEIIVSVLLNIILNINR